MKKLLAILLALGIIFSMVGCASEEKPAEESAADQVTDDPASDDKVVVGISSWSQANENCVILFDTVKVNLEEALGAEVIISDAQQDLNTQMDHFDNFITQGVDAIVSLFVDPNGISPSVEAANEAGIPVFGMTTVAESGDYYFIGSDEYDMGAMQAEMLAETLDENAKVLYLMNELGHDSQVKRSAGFKETLAELRPDIEILAEQKGNAVEEAMAVMEDWIIAYPEFDAVVSQTDNGILGAIQALKAAGIDDVVTLSIDGNTEAKDAVAAGELDATIAQDWVAMGEKCAEMIVGLQNGESYEQETKIEGYAITPENVEQYM